MGGPKEKWGAQKIFFWRKAPEMGPHFQFASYAPVKIKVVLCLYKVICKFLLICFKVRMCINTDKCD